MDVASDVLRMDDTAVFGLDAVTTDRDLCVWMQELGWDRWEAYEALTQIGGMYVGNMVDTTYSLVAKIAKSYALVNGTKTAMPIG